MASNWAKLQMTVAELHLDVTSSEVTKISDRLHSVTGFYSENETAEKNWDSMMKRLNQLHHDVFISNI